MRCRPDLDCLPQLQRQEDQDTHGETTDVCSAVWKALLVMAVGLDDLLGSFPTVGL